MAKQSPISQEWNWRETVERIRRVCATLSLAMGVCAAMAVGTQLAIEFFGYWWNLAEFHARPANLPGSREGVLTMITLTIITWGLLLLTHVFVIVGWILNAVASSSVRRRITLFIVLAMLLIASYWVTFQLQETLKSRFGRVRTLPSVPPQSL